jgi:hypothetical protein
MEIRACLLVKTLDFCVLTIYLPINLSVSESEAVPVVYGKGGCREKISAVDPLKFSPNCPGRAIKIMAYSA